MCSLEAVAVRARRNPYRRCVRRAKGDQLQGDEPLPNLRHLDLQDDDGPLRQVALGRHRLTEIEDLAPVEWLARPV